MPGTYSGNGGRIAMPQAETSLWRYSAARAGYLSLTSLDRRGPIQRLIPFLPPDPIAEGHRFGQGRGSLGPQQVIAQRRRHRLRDGLDQTPALEVVIDPMAPSQG